MAKVQEPLSDGLLAMMRDLPPAVQDAMALYRPHKLADDKWSEVREAVLTLIPLTAPPTHEALLKQLSPLIQFAMWTHREGFPLDAESMVTAERVETFREREHLRIAKGHSHFSKASINDYVSRLRQMGPLINPNGGWPPKAGKVKGGVVRGLRDPYTDKEVARFRLELATMPEDPKRDLAEALLLMGLGFGPQPGEMAAMTGAMVIEDVDGVWADVPGKHARRVPVAEPYAADLLALARRVGDEPLIVKASHKNALGEACRSVQLGRKRAALSPMRLRITWMVDRLRSGVDPRSLSAAAGLGSLTSAMELMQFVPTPDPVEQAALLRFDPRTAP